MTDKKLDTSCYQIEHSYFSNEIFNIDELPHKLSTIIKLPDETIQLIAAGEIITSPYNVVKELLENSLDAGATNVRITFEMGGMKRIEIVDNGCGIRQADAPLLCRRHATSKISKAGDLTRISTFGFRGEALASISEMADVEVKSFNKDVDTLGWQAKYQKGELIQPLQLKYKQNVGTEIKVTHLFSTDKSRKDAIKSTSSEEKKSILDLIIRYAIHHRDKVTITLTEDSPAKSQELICSLAPVSIKSCFGMFFGASMTNNMIEINVENTEEFKVEVNLVLSYRKPLTNYQQPPTFILFVNNRLVECANLKKDIEALVSSYLNFKQNVITTYVALKVPPCDIDVNTHPSKLTVTLHYQDEIISFIVQALRKKMEDNLSSQVLNTRTLLPQQQCVTIVDSHPQTKQPDQSFSEFTKRPHNLVHNDSSQPTIKQFITADKLILTNSNPRRLIENKLATSQQQQQQVSSQNTENVNRELVVSDNNTTIKQSNNNIELVVLDDSPMREMKEESIKPGSPVIMPPERPNRNLNLRSIYDLRQQIANEKTLGSAQTIKNSVFVGLFDHEHALIQHETKLYAINLKNYLKEQYYQFYLFDFGNFPPIEILPPGNKIQFFISIYLDDLRKYDLQQYEKLNFKTTQSVTEKLLKHSDMYEDYFALRLTDEELLTIPCIFPDEVPNLTYLGRFLCELVNLVDYSEERECLRQIGRVIANFYSEPPANLKDMNVHRSYHELVETKLYVAIKNYLLIPEWLFTRENICQISDTKDLYKVFERC